MPTRRDFVKTLALGAAALAAPRRLPAAAVAGRPNFVFFLADDLGWRDLGCFGSSFYETPNVDRLAKRGMRFTDAYAACPVCSPTRASIMTGKHPVRTGITTFIGAPQPDQWKGNTRLLPAPYATRLALEEVTLAEALKAGGYATFFAGKWHLGPEGFWPENQGFDVNMGGTDAGGPYGGNKYFSPYGNPRLKDGPPGEHLPDRLATETAKFIEAHKDRPFIAYLAFYSVHVPLMAREDLKKKYEEKAKALAPDGRPRFIPEGANQARQVQDHAVYAGMVEAMDLAVGKVLKKLEDLGLDRNTVVVFMSDNGGLSTAEGSPTSNVPLRAGKGWLYEGGIREPMIVRWPGVTAPGSVCASPVTSTDFYPTMLEMAGLPPRPEQHIDGASFVPLLKGGSMSRGPIFWHYPHYSNQGGSPGAAVRFGDWKLIEFFEDRRVELYNLREDVGEKTDLAKSNSAKAWELLDLLHAWQKATGAKFPSPNPGYRASK